MAVAIFIQLCEMKLLPAGSEVLLMHGKLQTLLPFNSLQLDFVDLRYMRNYMNGSCNTQNLVYLFKQYTYFLQYSHYCFDSAETDFPPRRSVLYCTDNHHITCCDVFFVVLFACLCRFNFQQQIPVSVLCPNVRRQILFQITGKKSLNITSTSSYSKL